MKIREILLIKSAHFLFVFALNIYKEKMVTIKIKDGCEVPCKPSFIKRRKLKIQFFKLNPPPLFWTVELVLPAVYYPNVDLAVFGLKINSNQFKTQE